MSDQGSDTRRFELSRRAFLSKVPLVMAALALAGKGLSSLQRKGPESVEVPQDSIFAPRRSSRSGRRQSTL